ncbi:IPT/TIG domain-containing protein [Kitasatospora sp. NPDC097643]|uniref:IPT/TIG domain-containing protein n=1 Tax=Kitasatospora sp. NPDC097643 TaxID=3157230 RepID=UPI003317F107
MSVFTRLGPLLSADGLPGQRFTLLPPGDAGIPVGVSPLGVALTPDGARAYVANRASNSVSVIDTATNTVTATIVAAGGPFLTAVSPDGTRVYVTLFDDGTLGVIDTATNTLTATIAVGAAAVAVALSPDGARAYVTSQGTNTLSVVDTATNTVTATVTTDPMPVGVAVSPDGALAYVCTVGESSVNVVDTATNTVTGSFTAGDVPVIAAFSPDGTRAYVCNAGGDSVSVVDTATNTVTATIGVGSLPRFVAVSPDGTAVYTTDFADNAVSVIDTATGTATGSIPVGNGPVCVAVTPAGNRLYVTDNADDAVAVVPLTLVPSQGTTAGGTIVTVRGHDLAPATAVRFGDTAATILGNTATSVTVKSPAGSGAVPVTVTTPGGTAVFGTFCYLPVPLLTGITTTSNPNGGAGPAMGPYTGGGTAVITGVNLSGTTSVRFGSRLATLQSVTDTAVTVDVPGVPSPGPVPVSIIASGESVGGLTFTYLDAPALTGVSPGSGPTGGGTAVTLTGNHLATTQDVTFDGIPAPFGVISDQTLTATAPPHPAGGDVTLEVTTFGGSGQTTFTYVDGPAV